MKNPSSIIVLAFVASLAGVSGCSGPGDKPAEAPAAAPTTPPPAPAPTETAAAAPAPSVPAPADIKADNADQAAAALDREIASDTADEDKE